MSGCGATQRVLGKQDTCMRQINCACSSGAKTGEESQPPNAGQASIHSCGESKAVKGPNAICTTTNICISSIIIPASLYLQLMKPESMLQHRQRPRRTCSSGAETGEGTSASKGLADRLAPTAANGGLRVWGSDPRNPMGFPPGDPKSSRTHVKLAAGPIWRDTFVAEIVPQRADGAVVEATSHLQMLQY